MKNLDEELNTRGFSNTRSGGCFDMISKKKETYLIKVLSNLDSFTENESKNMKTASYFLSATPLIIAERTRKSELMDGVMYKRFGIPALSSQSFIKFTDGAPLSIVSTRSGMSIELDTDAISRKMDEYEISIGNLSKRLNVTRNTARKCMRGGKFSLRLAGELENVIGERISKPVDMSPGYGFDDIGPSSRFEKSISPALHNLGVECSFIHRASFNFVARGRRTTIVKASENITLIRRTAPKMNGIAENLDIQPLIITKKSKYSEMNGIPVIEVADTENIETEKDLYKLIY
jgi:putative transcriptional regulator